MSTLDIRVYFKEERQMNAFVNMLAWMEYCGNIGHCTDFMVRVDGDGCARPKFMFANSELQESYEHLKREMNEIFPKTPLHNDGTDIHFSIS